MLRLGLVVIGVDDLERAAAFWTAALDYRAADRNASDRWRELDPPEDHRGRGCSVALQVSETPTQRYPRLHLDLDVDSPEEQQREADRIESLGGRRVDWDRWPDDPDFVVMEDTEGNRFCIVDASRA